MENMNFEKRTQDFSSHVLVLAAGKVAVHFAQLHNANVIQHCRYCKHEDGSYVPCVSVRSRHE